MPTGANGDKTGLPFSFYAFVTQLAMVDLLEAAAAFGSLTPHAAIVTDFGTQVI